MRAAWLAERLWRWAKGRMTRGRPNFVIGAANPQGSYLNRWWIIPRNPLLNVYLHEFLRDDDDRALHDHPWPSISIMLEGELFEQTDASDRRRLIRRGDIIFRRARHAHRLELHPLTRKLARANPVTVFITGPRLREWGFQCPNGWVHWRDFTAPGEKGEIGRGCGA